LRPSAALSLGALSGAQAQQADAAAAVAAARATRRSSPGLPSPRNCPPNVAPNKLVYRLRTSLPPTKGKQTGRRTVHLSRDFYRQWISMAPGEKTKTVFYADDKVFWKCSRPDARHHPGAGPLQSRQGLSSAGAQPADLKNGDGGQRAGAAFRSAAGGRTAAIPDHRNPDPRPSVKYIQATYTATATMMRSNRLTSISRRRGAGRQEDRRWIRDDPPMSPSWRCRRACRPHPTPNGVHMHENFPILAGRRKARSNSGRRARKLVTVGDGDFGGDPIAAGTARALLGDGPSDAAGFHFRGRDNLHWFQPGASGNN